MKRYTLTFALLFLYLFATQTAQCRTNYERKSISYINAVWLASPDARDIDNKQVGYLLEDIKESIEIPRFDYNPLPDELISDFVDAANDKESISVNDLADLMQSRLAPKIVEILQSATTDRGGELVSEEQRQGFMATKAKELGITLEEIEKVMNSAYIYLPVLTSIKKEEGKQKDKWIYTISGGIIWFHLSLSGDQPSVNLKIAKTTISKGFGSEEFAYQSAVRNFARNLQVATRDIKEFKLSAGIVEVDNGDIKFQLGIKEGIHLDECYLVGDWVEYPNGNMEFDYSGWVRVGSVGNNITSRTNYSSAWAVKKGSWVPGMVIVEHPRLPIDISLKPMLFTTKISKGRVPMIGSLFINDYMDITKDFDGLAAGFDIDAHYNLAAATGVSQLFAIVGGNFAFPASLEFQAASGFTVLTASPPFIWGLHGGILKKKYYGQIALTVEAKGGMRFFTVTQDFEIFGSDYTFEMRNNTVGGQLTLGCDYAATPDFNIGVGLGYRIYTVSDIWTVDLNGESAEFTADDTYPEIDHSGLAIGLYLHWSVPELPFDPADWIRGAMGE